MLACLQSDRDRHRCAVASDKLLFGEVDSGHNERDACRRGAGYPRMGDSGHNERDACRRGAGYPRMGEDAGGFCGLGQCPHLRTGGRDED